MPGTRPGMTSLTMKRYSIGSFLNQTLKQTKGSWVEVRDEPRPTFAIVAASRLACPWKRRDADDADPLVRYACARK